MTDAEVAKFDADAKAVEQLLRKNDGETLDTLAVKVVGLLRSRQAGS